MAVPFQVPVVTVPKLLILKAVPTDKSELGVDELIPTQPFELTTKTVEVAKAAVEEETRNNGTAPPAMPAKENLAEGEEVPTPTFPTAIIVNVEVACQAVPW